MSYVTGSHSAKFGVYNVTASATSTVPDNFAKLTYRFNNGVPNQLTQRATPLDRAERQRFDLGLYAQDKWTLNRLTLSGGASLRHVPELLPRADARTGAPRAQPEHHVPEDRHGQLEGHRAADGRAPTTCSATAGRR